MTVALFPGSFDPFHDGHAEIVERAHGLFESVVVAVVHYPAKGPPLFDIDERTAMLAECLTYLERVRIVTMTGLVVALAAEVGAGVIVKGLRAVSDFEHEMQMAQMNRHLSGIDTAFIASSSEHSFIASRLVREVARLGGDVSALVPPPVAVRLKERFPAR